MDFDFLRFSDESEEEKPKLPDPMEHVTEEDKKLFDRARDRAQEVNIISFDDH